MSKVVARARAYLAENAAESGADVLIAEMIDELERLYEDYFILRDGFASIDAIVRAPDALNAIFSHPRVGN